MEEQFDKKREDSFQRTLVTFFFHEKLGDKERRKVIWIVRLTCAAVVLILAMLVTLATESIFSFFWFVTAVVVLYVMLKISGLLRKRRHVNE